MRAPRLVLGFLLAVLAGGATAQSVTPAPGEVPKKLPEASTTAPTTQPIVLPPSLDRLRPVPVVWFFGQSNAEGGSPGFYLREPTPTGPRHPELADQREVRIWWPGNTPLRPGSVAGWEGYVAGLVGLPVNNASGFIVEGTFGAEASLGYTLRKRLGEPVYVFKFTAVAALHPSAAVSFSKRAGAGGLYDRMLTEWRRAADALRAQGLVPDIRGFFWLHGESDHNTGGTWAREYGTHLERLIADLRHDLAGDTGAQDGPVRAPFVIAAMHPNHVPASSWDSSESAIRNGSRLLAGSDPRVAWVETADLPLDKTSPSHVHFNGEGLVRLGHLLADAWWPLARDR